jgi:hypothetical protein
MEVAGKVKSQNSKGKREREWKMKNGKWKMFGLTNIKAINY